MVECDFSTGVSPLSNRTWSDIKKINMDLTGAKMPPPLPEFAQTRHEYDLDKYYAEKIGNKLVISLKLDPYQLIENLIKWHYQNHGPKKSFDQIIGEFEKCLSQR